MNHKELFRIRVGSHLYGTNTKDSDEDWKSIYLPELKYLITCRTPSIYKTRFGPDGEVIGASKTMVAGGTECEHIPVQRFAVHFVEGQAYAIEVAHAIVQANDESIDEGARQFCQELIEKFSTTQVHGMMGFARKQTMDYVHRGDRLKNAQQIQKVLAEFDGDARLDSATESGTLLDVIAEKTGMSIGSTQSGEKTFRTIMFNGRHYVETSKVAHLQNIITKMINSYGERTKLAAAETVEWKSLSHAVRVYEQVVELLESGQITFPRPNTEILLKIKKGQVPFEDVKEMLINIENKIESVSQTTKLRPYDPKVLEELNDWLVLKLLKIYGISNL